MATCTECEEKERTSKTRNEETQGGCVKCIRGSQSYDHGKCTACIETATADDKFPNFKKAQVSTP